MRSTASRDRAVEAELVEDRRPELADERPHVAELAAEQLAQEAQLRPGQRRVVIDDPLDVLDLEDRVRERLGRPVVDLLGEPRPLRLLGLDDPHLDVVRRSPGRRPSLTSVASPRSRKSHVRSRLRSGELELGQLGLVAAELAGQLARRRRGAAPARASSAPASRRGGAAVRRRSAWCRPGPAAVRVAALDRRRARRGASCQRASVVGVGRRGSARGRSRSVLRAVADRLRCSPPRASPSKPVCRRACSVAGACWPPSALRV